jgi:hypothetical protein
MPAGAEFVLRSAIHSQRIFFFGVNEAIVHITNACIHQQTVTGVLYADMHGFSAPALSRPYRHGGWRYRINTTAQQQYRRPVKAQWSKTLRNTRTRPVFANALIHFFAISFSNSVILRSRTL